MEFINNPQASEAQSNLLPLQLTVLRARNLPRLKTFYGKERQFYANITYGERTWRTRSVPSTAQRVEWNENVDTFAVRPLSRITVSLYAEKRTRKKDILLGRQEIDCVPQHELDIVFSSTDRHTTGPITLSLIVTVSANASSLPSAPVNTQDPTAVVDYQGGTACPTVQSNDETAQPTAGGLPIEACTPAIPVAESQIETSRKLDSAEEAMDAIKTWRSAVDVVKQVMDYVGPIVKLFPHATSAWELLSKIPETLLHQFQRDDNVRALLTAIRDSFEIAKEADALKNMDPASTQAKILDEMLEYVSESAKFIISYAEDVRVEKRTLKSTFGKVDEKIDNYRTNLLRLRDNFLSHGAVISQAAVLDVLDAELSAIIRDLPYKGGWRFGDEKRCLKGTREDFLKHITKWVENPNSERGLVLVGQAGTGKSSIAHEIARRFERSCLGSYFTFLRKEGSKDDVYQLFTTIARDLSDRHSSFRTSLGRVVKNNSSLCASRDYRTLFERLLVEPLRDVPLPGPVLIVIDALDESGDAIGNIGLHSFLAQRLIDLPSGFRVLITSRPENGIEPAFSKALSIDTLYMNDAKLASKTEQDITTYLEKQLPPDVFKDHGIKLAKSAEGMFQWATVASGFINSPASLGLTMKRRVERLLGHSRGRTGEGLLDNLYEEVLKEYFKTDEAQTLFRFIMGQVLAAIEPLSIESFISLLRHIPVDDPEDSDPVPVLEILGHLGSLLSNVTSSNRTGPIVPLHTSFRDFLTNKRSNLFYVDLEAAHHQLAHSCLGLLLEDLKFNICKLESSYLANSDVPDLNARITKHIQPALSYACGFWSDHLGHVAFEHDLFEKLECFFKTKFLFWLEVLSLTSRVRLGLRALSSLLKWLQREHSQTQLFALVHDGSAFVRYFGMALARSAPHIYISALPFAPSSSRIVNQYLWQFPRRLTLERGQLRHWPALEMMIDVREEQVNSVAFSPDGQQIASASASRIHVWDATTGEMVAGPFTGHTSCVSSIAFSPDGQRIASASWDHTICVWNIVTGDVAGPFTGHTDWVRHVTFSPDGHRIASASADRTIRVWDAATGRVVASPFSGHTFWVNCVAFSPDGQCIASASSDHTIRVWDSATGKEVLGPLTGHANPVYSVAFSPDGHHIASASSDNTIRVWDTSTGGLAVGPFTGHTRSVESVVFSPDGHHIASASSDHTVRVWDAATGGVLAGPFTGHMSCVNCVAFSPDGQRIASASADHTIRVWDAATQDVVEDLFTGHPYSVISVVSSPDGQRIASASADHTILVWDAATGEIVAGPFTGHTNQVNRVAFSPDGELIASASDDRTIRVWDSATGEAVAGPFTGHTGLINCIAFSPDGLRIASASGDEPICVWDATTGEVVSGQFDGHTDWVNSVAFSPDAQLIASASYDPTFSVWNVATGEVVAGPFTEHTSSVTSVAFSPDGQRIASASFDRTICVWDVETGEIVEDPFIGHTHSVSCVSFSPDGQHIASASFDYTTCVWDAATGEVIAGPFTGHTSEVLSVAFLLDGQLIVSGSSDGVIRVEKVTTEGIENIDFIDQFQICKDGWIYGDDGELLLWIPALHQPCLHRSSTVWTAGRHATRLNFSKFVHGSNWTAVRDNDLHK